MSAALTDIQIDWAAKFTFLNLRNDASPDAADTNASAPGAPGGAAQTGDCAPGGATQTADSASGGSAQTGDSASTGNPAPPHVTPADKTKQSLYLKENGDANDVSENDIHQDDIADCFFVSSIAEIAKVKPELIKKIIQDNGDGTYTITLHVTDDGIGNLWGLTGHDYKEVKIKVNGDTPDGAVNSRAGQAEQDGKKEIWPMLLEKAFAQLKGGYSKIDHGNSADALATITGHDADQKSVSSFSADDLKDAMTRKKPLVFNSPGDKKGKGKKGTLPFGVHPDHSYIFEGVTTGKDGKTQVILKNPWGSDDPDPIPFDQLGKSIDTISAGSVN